jgi:hypothetical protein
MRREAREEVRGTDIPKAGDWKEKRFTLGNPV